jgi:hypothetical protein
MADGDEIVGHKTFSTGDPLQPFRHEPLTRSEADALWERAEHLKRQRAADMPNEEAAITTMFNAWLRLKELGWREAIYSPKDGSSFKVIEPGSTGIHDCIYMGEWPDGAWWIQEAGDLWPSRPVLFKPDGAVDSRGASPKEK